MCLSLGYCNVAVSSVSLISPPTKNILLNYLEHLIYLKIAMTIELSNIKLSKYICN